MEFLPRLADMNNLVEGAVMEGRGIERIDEACLRNDQPAIDQFDIIQKSGSDI